MWNSAWMIPMVTIVVAIVHQSAAFAPAPVVLSKRRAPTSPSPLFASSSETDLAKREELKTQLLASAEEFKSIQSNLTNAVTYETKMEKDADGQRYHLKLLRRIVRKVKGRKPKNTKSILSTDSFATLRLEVGEAGNKTIAIAEQLAKLNPTSNPTYGWMGYGGGSPSDCKLQGQWKLKFTTAADATFPENAKRGKAVTSQEIDAKAGTFTNVVDFEKGNTLGFRVVVAGKAVSDTEIELHFQRVILFRNGRFFKKIIFPIPTRLLRLINRISSRGKASKRGPYFGILYLDDNLRMHKTGEGNWFIQSRLE